MTRLILLSACILASLPAQVLGQVGAEDYARAEWFLPENVREHVRNTAIEPHWSGDRFWYGREIPGGKQFVIVDARQGTSRLAFDHERLAEALSLAADTTVAATGLPLDSIDFASTPAVVHVGLGEATWVCEIAAYRCHERDPSPGAPEGSVRSPDGRWDAFVRGHDLYLREVESGTEFRITRDGAEHHAYAMPTEATLNHVSMQRSGLTPEAAVVWSPDSRRLITQRVDEREVEDAYLVQVAPAEGVRPRLYRYRYPLPGDSVVPMARFFVVDVERKTIGPVHAEPVTASPESPLPWRTWWSDNAERVYYLEHERGYKTVHLREVDPETGRTRTVLSERDTSYIDLNAFPFGEPNVRLLGGGEEILWFSERDGWGQLYLHEGDTGRLKNRVTTGEFVVRDIKHLDEENRLVYFTATGVEEGRDPYFRHLYRAHLDGSDLTLLTPEDADHWVRFSPDGQYFTDTYAWGGHTPTTVLRDASGELVRVVEEADLSALRDKGWRWPERFRVKARDGTTDIYGVLYRPTTFDPAKSYPVLDNIYPGPQRIHSPLSYAGDPVTSSGIKTNLLAAQAMSELGFIVLIVDGMGTPLRSRAFREVSYGDLGDAGGLEDHVAALRQLSRRHPYIDPDRVGIYGFSGGGYASTRALLLHPDVYKVAVSVSGNHDQRGYIRGWGEMYQGYPVDDSYQSQANADLAERLEGKLLLVHGDMDDNVHPAHTMQLVDALIEANKNFDLLLLPNRNHGGAAGDPYFIRRRWDYFVRHLMDEQPPEYWVGPEETKADREP